jgi:predicted Zn-dependent peptidase
LDYLRQYNDMINALTVEQLQAAMQHYWTADAFSLAVAGPELNGAAY